MDKEPQFRVCVRACVCVFSNTGLQYQYASITFLSRLLVTLHKLCGPM